MEAGFKSRAEAAFGREDRDELARLARESAASLLRFLSGRLYSADEAEKWKAVRTFGALSHDGDLLSDEKLSDLLRRFFWWLNDESGAVPYGVPEAIGAILAARPMLQESYLPMLCAMSYHGESFQVGAIERGLFWALGHIGPAVALRFPEAVEAVKTAARRHPDPETRVVAGWALARCQPERESCGGINAIPNQ